MAENSKISWTHHTFNPWVGCTKVSPACDHCYAEGWAKRTGQAGLWNGERRRTSAANWRGPIKWDTAAAIAGERQRVFCASLADVFDNQAEPEWLADLWRLIEVTPNLDWLLLTKRPQNIARMLPPNWGDGYPNVWLGTTVENQLEAARRIPSLLHVPARVHFLSCEPLLGPLDLRRLNVGANGRDALTGFENYYAEPHERSAKIDWVIAGGESGPGARPMHPAWARSLRDQCARAGVAFHFKQWGEWLPGENFMLERPVEPAQWQDGEIGRHSLSLDERRAPEWRHYEPEGPGSPGAFGIRIGKARAGRELDGQLHDGFPA